MKLNVVEDSKDSLIIEFIDVDRSLPELIKDRLLQKKEVEFAGVIRDHPEKGYPKLVVKSSKNAKTIVLNSIEELQEEIKEMAGQIKIK